MNDDVYYVIWKKKKKPLGSVHLFANDDLGNVLKCCFALTRIQKKRENEVALNLNET